MIRRLKYNEIDFEKYSKCLENSAQKNWYARRSFRSAFGKLAYFGL
jgi:hypothetical protein